MSSEQLAALKATLRERGKPENPTVVEMRARIAEVGERFPAPAEAEVTPVTVAGRPAEWVAAPGSGPLGLRLWVLALPFAGAALAGVNPLSRTTRA